MPDVTIEIGLTGAATLTVGAADTAVALGSGSVHVLATPRLVALCEQATCAAVAGRLAAGATTVGTRVALDHSRPTAVGREVTAQAVLTRVEGRRLTFEVSAADERGQVASGEVTRAVVDVDRLMEAAR